MRGDDMEDDLERIKNQSIMNNPAPFNLPEIGKRLRTIRAYQRKTQSTMAKELGISLSHYSKLEIGIGGMSRGLAFALCRQFEVPEQWLLYGEGEQPDLAAMTAKSNAKPAATTQPMQTVSDELIVRIVEIVEQDEHFAAARHRHAGEGKAAERRRTEGLKTVSLRRLTMKIAIDTRHGAMQVSMVVSF